MGQEPRLTAFVLPPQYHMEPAQLVTRQLQVSVWHLGALTRRVFLGEVTIPLATWDYEDSSTQGFCWYPLRAKVTCSLGLSFCANETHSKGFEERKPSREALALTLGWKGPGRKGFTSRCPGWGRADGSLPAQVCAKHLRAPSLVAAWVRSRGLGLP